MKGIILLLFLPFSLLPNDGWQENPDRKIKSLNEGMEEAFARGDMAAVSQYYLDEAVMLSPGQPPVSGREEIDAYWMRTRDPVSWKLEVFLVSRKEEDIYAHEFYQSLASPPPSWHDQEIMEHVKPGELVYQLGRSTLTARYNGELHSSVVAFILVWQKTDDSYKILVDTYSW